ncbi:TetR/AcrR family transcriptional regulator [Paenibacillus athensensis]|nr:TetR/AcrR family transcriptional regulator [Paenibacillus athensensis]MCD1259271.1 TetR/AcrR family transcriptional regulator [Paenibacillus athensensis]
MNGFEKRAHRIKETIQTTTLELLRTSGPENLRIADIAKAARVSQVTIYNYFGSKEGLLREAFKSYIDDATRNFEAYMNEGHSLKEKIAHILLKKNEMIHEFPPRLIQQLMQADQELARYMEEQYAGKALPLTLRMIEEGKQNGEISAHVSAESVLALMRVYMNQYEQMLNMAQQSADVEAFLEGMVHLFFYGICGKE